LRAAVRPRRHPDASRQIIKERHRRDLLAAPPPDAVSFAATQSRARPVPHKRVDRPFGMSRAGVAFLRTCRRPPQGRSASSEGRRRLSGGCESFLLCRAALSRGGTMRCGTSEPAKMGTSPLGRNYWSMRRSARATAICRRGVYPVRGQQRSRCHFPNGRRHAASISWLRLTVCIPRCAPPHSAKWMLSRPLCIIERGGYPYRDEGAYNSVFLTVRLPATRFGTHHDARPDFSPPPR
jgi:hypothetical protein